MSLDFDFEKMEQLLICFYQISNVRYSLADVNNNLVCFSSDLSDFCARMNALPEGHARCKQCDADGIECVNKRKMGYYSYRCHAGLVETVIPVRQHGEIIAYIFFGQMAGCEDMEKQWKKTREDIEWFPNADSMRTPFFQLRQVNSDTIDGCARILEACSSYIWMEGVIRSGSMSDEQLLNHYITEHYSEALTLDTIAKALSMSKTKLCSIAAKQGTTVMNMVNTRRMEEAKRLFRHKNDRVAEVAYQVGVRDYNYFSKLFKAYTGKTPSAYRNQYRKQ
ncbi:MAG: PocR ligand-binding domain-containing protein [Clostridia bacterium]